jgi:hypothetical protein
LKIVEILRFVRFKVVNDQREGDDFKPKQNVEGTEALRPKKKGATRRHHERKGSEGSEKDEDKAGRS